MRIWPASGLIEMRRQRLEALIAQLTREALLARDYPEVVARLIARRTAAERELEELRGEMPRPAA